MMMYLDRITTVYAHDEDRICLNALSSDGGAIRVWLTQRILHRLVPELAKRLKPKHSDSEYASLLASVAQQRAVDRHSPLPPVESENVEHQWLVAKIDLQWSETRIVFVFTSAAGDAAQLAMEPELLRQWLAILRRVYISAEWSGADWPDWIDTPSPSTSTRARVLH